ncbi:DUF4105 domain-containing protein [Flavobacteriaceae bacterium S356]|uniref:DUF4105 domain-containing protein n=1 Tax=Asprobacillus argus TaxID=3076534 RepID=A0ABU3LEB1_9FLAO|nr:DUF4105 domain-containing protein [Flavobacteriaceae bacterium S356]
MKRVLLTLLFIFSAHLTFAQYLKLSVYSEVSIVTVGPGENLYEVFGHSTVRIKDPVLNFDLAYNYGVFDFSKPGFYSNFAKGKLEYLLARYPFHNFIRSNQQDKRWVKEQVLDLTQEQKQQFFEFLEHNAKLENAYYLYDPYFNNCATKLRDISRIILKDSIQLGDEYVSGDDTTLRQLMNNELYWNTWGSLGINIALGTILDKKATADQYLYLPDYVFEAFKKGTIVRDGVEIPIVKKENDILVFEETESSFTFLSPLGVLFLFLFIGILITYRDLKRKRRSKWFDFTLFFITGVIGIGIVFLWFFTDHKITPNNFNVLWAFAPNSIIAFYLLKRNPNSLVKKYIWIVQIFLAVLVVIWLTGVQLFAISLIPLLLLLGIRYYYLLTSKE